MISPLEGSNPSPSANRNDMTTDLASTFLELGAATLGESGGRPDGAAHPAGVARRARAAVPRFRSRAARPTTSRCTSRVAEAPPGSVLVVSVGLEPERGYWGEVLTTGAEARGIAGLVIDGGVRDVDALEAHQFPVFSSMIALRGATKNQHGRIGDAALVGDVDVETGDWIVGDTDGVVVIPQAQLDDVRAAGRGPRRQGARLLRPSSRPAGPPSSSSASTARIDRSTP